MEALIILIVVIGLSVALSLGISSLINLYCDLTEKKRKQAHPELWVWFQECDEAGQAECHWHNTQIAPLKRKVDAILREWDYYSADTKSKKEEELEDLRKAIEKAHDTYLTMHDKTEAIRSKIHDYVEQHDLKWAKNRGW